MRTFQVYLPKTPFESFGTSLDNKTVQMTMVWNERQNSYSITVSDDANNSYIEGARLVPFSPIKLRELAPDVFKGDLQLMPFSSSTVYENAVTEPEHVSEFYTLRYYTDLDE